jgi:hypothetical protein
VTVTDWQDQPSAYQPDPPAPPSPGLAEHGLGRGSGTEVLYCDHPGCTFDTLSPAGLARHKTRQHGGPVTITTPLTDQQAVEEEEVAEQVPRPPRGSDGRGLLGRLRDRANRPAKPKAAAPSRARPTRSRGARISIATDLATAWYGVGRRMETTPHYPAGRMMALQAPAAGLVIDRALDGTLVDKILVQPLWRTKDQWEDVFYVAAPPLLLVMIQNARMRAGAALEAGETETAARLEGWARAQSMALEQILRSSLLRIAPAMAEAKARAEAEDRIIRDAFPDLEGDDDPVAALLSDLFAPPPWAGLEPEPQEAQP